MQMCIFSFTAYSEIQVQTPTGRAYKGLKYEKGNCGVSTVRSGEAMEKALQDCCRSMRIGKILVDSDSETHEARVIFAKFPYDIAERKVLLLYPIMNSGNKVCRAIRVVLDHKVPEDHVILINLFRSKFHIQPKPNYYQLPLNNWRLLYRQITIFFNQISEWDILYLMPKIYIDILKLNMYR